jgi:putative cell wall-binding protein
MKAVAHMRRLAAAVLVTACLLALPAAPALAVDVIAPAPQPYVLTGFGADPLGSAGPKVSMQLTPAHPDGYFGWFVTVPRLMLAADRSSAVRYVWDDPSGQWQPYGLPLLVPEGKHVLYAQADDGAHVGPLTAMEVKVDLRSQPVNGTEFDSLGVSASDVGSSIGTVNIRASVKPWAGPRVIRVWGSDRYSTSEQIAQNAFRSADTVVVARGDDFPDALSAAALAGIYDAPIVLTRPKDLPSVVSEVLTTLKTKNAIIVGSVRAVSSGVEQQLKSKGIAVERIGGSDRYDTANLIARAVIARGGTKGKAFIARGDLFPDSLAVSPFAYCGKRPILLVRPTSLPDVTAKALADLGITDVVIAGSVRAVSQGVEDSIARTPGVHTRRAAGADRYATAVEAAHYGIANALGTFKMVGIATGQNFPDALCGGAAMGHFGGVILMTPKDKLADVTRQELAAHGPELRDIQVYGGEAAVSRSAWDGILQAIR